jgi:mannonate dehydratase
MLTAANFRFARQCGATHIVAHLVDYFAGGQLHGTDERSHWGVTRNAAPWSEEQLGALKASVEAEGLTLEAIENFDPAQWHDVLLDGPRRAEQIETVKTILRRMGRVGIPTMGYNFSLAGVWGHVVGPWARGGAEAVAFLGEEGPRDTPIPPGQIWNMVYDPDAAATGDGRPTAIAHEELWRRLGAFLDEVIPVAEEAGVRLALHPDDPPMPTLRDTPRLVYQPSLYDRVLELRRSPANALEFCLGSIQEMTEGDVYEATDRYSRQGAIAYVHFRNVRGKVPRYHEVFVDEGDIDMHRILRILKKNDFGGVLIPDHTPSLECDAPWHAGMAFALGYMRAALQQIERDG